MFNNVCRRWCKGNQYSLTIPPLLEDEVIRLQSKSRTIDTFLIMHLLIINPTCKYWCNKIKHIKMDYNYCSRAKFGFRCLVTLG